MKWLIFLKSYLSSYTRCFLFFFLVSGRKKRKTKKQTASRENILSWKKFDQSLMLHKSHAVLSGPRLCHCNTFNLLNVILGMDVRWLDRVLRDRSVVSEQSWVEPTFSENYGHWNSWLDSKQDEKALLYKAQ